MKIKLTKAFLNKEKTLIKIKDGENFGIYDIIIKKQITPIIYSHIFDYDESDTCVAIIKKQYIGIDKFGNQFQLFPAKITEYKGFIIKADPCNCRDGCEYCEFKGLLFNEYALNNNLKYLKGFNDFNF